MANATPFSLRIFVADGDPDGLRLVERSNWIGKAVMFPRALYPQVRGRAEFNQTGVYLLLGPRPQGDGEMIYIGEGDPVRPLEAQLISRATAAKRAPLDNGNRPTEPTLSEADRADMDVFLDNILGMLPVMGIHAFEQSPPVAGRGGMPLLTCQGRGVTANGRDTPQGFVVQAASFASADEVPSLKEHFPSVCELRADLRGSGVLIADGDRLRFAQDYTFSSPSLASSVVLGRSSNGRTDWKDAGGRTLKELQEAQAQG